MVAGGSLDRLFMAAEAGMEGPNIALSNLKKLVSRPVSIRDSKGKQLFPVNGCPQSNRDLVARIPMEALLSEYHYDRKNRDLFYKVSFEDEYVFVVISDLPEKKLRDALSAAEGIELAIKNYFIKTSSQVPASRPYLFLEKPLKINGIYDLIKQHLHNDANYVVEVCHLESSTTECDWREVYRHEIECLEKMKHDVLCIGWQDYLVYVVPTSSANDTRYNKYAMESALLSMPNTGDMRKKFDIQVASYYGNEHAFCDVDQSYREAMITCIFSHLVNRKRYSAAFSYLGLLVPLFSLPHTEVKSVCSGMLKPLLDYDLHSDISLFETLKVLVDCDFNWRMAATILNIHVNTLYYRAKKIAQCMHMDFSYPDNRANVTLAIRILETYQLLEDF